MRSNSSEILNLIHRQTKVILMHFEDELSQRGFLLSSASQFEVRFINHQNKELVIFHQVNDYRYGDGLQPLQDITIVTSKGETRLSTIVDESENKGALRNYLKNRPPGQTRSSVFVHLMLKYFFGENKTL